MLKRRLFHTFRLMAAFNSWTQRRLTRGGRLLLWSAFFALAVGIDTNFTMAYQALAFLLCLMAISMTWGYLSRARFSARRILPRFGTVGMPLPYRIVLHNQTPRPQRGVVLLETPADPRPSLRQFLETPEPGEEQRNVFDRTCGYYRWRWLLSQNLGAEWKDVEVPCLPPGGSLEVPHALLPHKRGRLRLSGVTAAWPDPFGLFRSLRRIPCPQSVLILPRRYPLSAPKLPGTRKYQPGGVTLASVVGESEEFMALRDYRPGDPLRRIHWRSLAKTDKPIIKEYQDEFFARHALVLDTFSARGEGEVFEEAVSVAASFACTIPDQDSLLDLLFVGAQAYCFTAGRSVAHAAHLLEILAGVTVCREQSFAVLEQLVLERVAAVTSCICVLLDWDSERQRLVERLQQLGIPLVVLVITAAGDPAELDPGPLRDCPECFHPLAVGKVAEGLARL